MKDDSVLKNWRKADKKQLDFYIQCNSGKQIQCGDKFYFVQKGFIDSPHDIPTVILIDIDGYMQMAKLSLIWSEYQNYSALSDEKRKALLQKFLIKE